MTAAEYAAILDPERKVEGWWTKYVPYACPHCSKPLHGNPMYPPYEDLEGGYRCLSCRVMHSSEFTYIGPDDLHTARSEAWRGEEWLLARDCQITIDHQGTSIEGGPLTGYSLIASNTDHAAAIAEAVRRVHRGE